MPMAFGNRTGWSLAVVVLAIEAAALTYALSLDRPTPPTELSTRPEATGPLTFAVEPRTLLDPTEAGADAAATYRALADAYAAEPYAIDRFLRTRDRATLPSLTFVGPMIEATTRRASSPLVEFAGYDADPPRLAALQAVGRATTVAGLLSLRDDPKRARACYDAAYSLGLRLVEERSSWRSFFAGVELMSTAAAARAELSEKANDAADASKCRAFADALRDRVRDQWLPLFEAIDTRREPLIATHAGDVVAIAANANADRLFRTAAILKLGRMRFNLGDPPRPANRPAVERALESLEEREPDQILKRAVTLARTLSVEQFRTLR